MFHSQNPTLFGRPELVVAETETLRSTIGRLRHLSHLLRSEGSCSAFEARSLLSDFSAQLSGYFGAEEDHGYFGTITVEHPSLGPQVVALEHAHDELRDSVASLRRFARDEGESIELGRRIDHVIDGFEQHEHEENDLLQEFFLRDEGSGD